MRYFMRLKGGATSESTTPDQVNTYFRIIESLTGLDRAMAETILRSGQAIDHPEREWFSDTGGRYEA